MNTEKMIPISYVKQFTPLVKGDEVKWYRNGTWVTATVKNEKVNTIYPGQLHTNKGIFSDVELSEYGVFIVSFADRPNTGKQPVADDVVVEVSWHMGSREANASNWRLDPTLNNESWKPNHAAMLAKFKEQGANTMNEQEHKAKSHEVALMTNALDDNPDEQVIEPYVADQLDDLINPVSEGCQAGDVISVPYSELPPCNGEIPKPVFTQEMADDFKIPKVGSDVEIFDAPSGSYVKCEIICHHKKALFIAVDGWDAAVSVADDSLFRPIDNRSDEERLRDAVWESTELRARDGAAGVVNRLLSSDKFTIALNK